MEHQAVQSASTLISFPLNADQMDSLQQQDEQIKTIIYQVRNSQPSQLHKKHLIHNNVLYFIQQGETPCFLYPTTITTRLHGILSWPPIIRTSRIPQGMAEDTATVLLAFHAEGHFEFHPAMSYMPAD